MPNPYEIAARRFEQIAFLIDPSLDAAQRRVAWQKRSGDAGRSTLFRWLKAYREHGYMGLLPKPRSDRGKTRKAGPPPGSATRSGSCTSSLSGR